MQLIVRYILIACLALICDSATAQNQQREMPRAAIIGDFVYMQHARGVGAELKDKVNVEHRWLGHDSILNSSTAIEHLDQLLGRADASGKPIPEEKWPTWDLIHINVGLGDLVHRAPTINDFRLMPIHAGGVIATTPEQYEKNLDELISQLKTKAPNAKIIWASTTPIRSSRSNVFVVGSAADYNKIAAKIMAKHDVPINDMHSYVKELIDMDKPAPHGFDPFNFDKKQIHAPIVAVIARAFNVKVDTESTN